MYCNQVRVPWPPRGGHGRIPLGRVGDRGAAHREAAGGIGGQACGEQGVAEAAGSVLRVTDTVISPLMPRSEKGMRRLASSVMTSSSVPPDRGVPVHYFTSRICRRWIALASCPARHIFSSLTTRDR